MVELGGADAELLFEGRAEVEGAGEVELFGDGGERVGALFDHLGAPALFAISALIVLTGGILFRWHQRHLAGLPDDSGGA